MQVDMFQSHEAKANDIMSLVGEEAKQTLLGGFILENGVHCLHTKVEEDHADSRTGAVCVNPPQFEKQTGLPTPKYLGNAKVGRVMLMLILVAMQLISESRLTLCVNPHYAFRVNAHAFRSAPNGSLISDGKNILNFFLDDFFTFVVRSITMNIKLMLFTVDIASDIIAPVVQHVPREVLNFPFLLWLTKYPEFWRSALIWMCVVAVTVLLLFLVALNVSGLASRMWALPESAPLWDHTDFRLKPSDRPALPAADQKRRSVRFEKFLRDVEWLKRGQWREEGDNFIFHDRNDTIYFDKGRNLWSNGQWYLDDDPNDRVSYNRLAKTCGIPVLQDILPAPEGPAPTAPAPTAPAPTAPAPTAPAPTAPAPTAPAPTVKKLIPPDKVPEFMALLNQGNLAFSEGTVFMVGGKKHTITEIASSGISVTAEQ